MNYASKYLMLDKDKGVKKLLINYLLVTLLLKKKKHKQIYKN